MTLELIMIFNENDVLLYQRNFTNKDLSKYGYYTLYGLFDTQNNYNGLSMYKVKIQSGHSIVVICNETVALKQIKVILKELEKSLISDLFNPEIDDLINLSAITEKGHLIKFIDKININEFTVNK